MKKQTFYGSSAWRWFRKYNLLKHAKESNGVYYVTCATSNRLLALPDKKTHLGHLVPVFDGNSTNLATAFDERNCLPQCYQDNSKRGGRPLKMMESIERIYGEGTVSELVSKSKKWCKLDKVDLKDISDEYRLKFKELAKIKGDPWSNSNQIQ